MLHSAYPRHAVVPLSTLVLFLTIGCSQQVSTETTQPTEQVASNTKPTTERASRETAFETESSVEPAKEISLQVVEPEQYLKVIEKNKGKVVLVDFWATWCLPCKAQFPHTVELSRKYADQDVAVVSMSLDEPENEERVLKFLQDQHASFDNLLSKYGGGEASYESYAIPGGSIPHYKLYDRKGVERYTFEVDPLAEKQFSHEDIEAKLKELLAESAGK